MRWLAPSREKQAWKAECIERCPLGLGKGSWRRADDQSTGTETVRFNPSRQPFWKRGHAPASYFMKQCKLLHVPHLIVWAKWPGKPVRGSEVFWELNCLLDYSIWRRARCASDTVLSGCGMTSFCLHVSSCPPCSWHGKPPWSDQPGRFP